MFHVTKQSRVYSGEPYCGPTSDNKPAEYATIEKALEARNEFQHRNPVGWNVFNGITKKLVEGHDFSDKEPL